MKTLITFLILTFAALTSFSQIDSISLNRTLNDSLSQFISILKQQDLDHFKFKGVPIDGSINQFVAQLKKQGFTVLKTTAVDAILTGKFTGEEVYVLVQAGSKNVYGVTVVFNEQPSWNSIKYQYLNVKYLLTAKYGNPQETIEKFESPDYEDLGLELLALSEDKCTYMTVFATDTGNGLIKLSISSDASIVLNYVDTLNYLLVFGDAIDDL